MREYSLEICDTIAEISALYSLYYRSMFISLTGVLSSQCSAFHCPVDVIIIASMCDPVSPGAPIWSTLHVTPHHVDGWWPHYWLIFNYRCQITGESFLLLASCGWGVWLFVNTVALRFDQTQSLARDNVFIEMLLLGIDWCVCVHVWIRPGLPGPFNGM